MSAGAWACLLAVPGFGLWVAVAHGVARMPLAPRVRRAEPGSALLGYRIHGPEERT